MRKLTEQQPGTGAHIMQWGARIGYWPCLRGPFAALYWGKHRFYLWYGLPSYNRT